MVVKPIGLRVPKCQSLTSPSWPPRGPRRAARTPTQQLVSSASFTMNGGVCVRQTGQFIALRPSHTLARPALLTKGLRVKNGQEEIDWIAPARYAHSHGRRVA